MIKDFKSDKKDCCGCSACAQACPKNCIEMKCDEEGFLYPFVNKDVCISCGLCERSCPIINQKPKSEKVLSAFAGYIKDEDIRIKSSSGGLFSALSEYFINNNAVVYGAAIDSNSHVYHTKALSFDSLEKLRGSKYVQSDINNVYLEVKEYLDKGTKVLFTGTACQISGLKSFLKNEYENLYSIDVLCHGTPSPKLLKKYIDHQQKQHGSKVRQIFFRNKKTGWKMYSVQILFSDSTEYIEVFPKDIFMRLFLGNICLRPSCYDCKFKALERDSDLSVGDAWGIHKVMPELDDDKGTSVILVHTPKGLDLLDSISNSIIIKEGNADDLLPASADSRKSVKIHPNRLKFFKKLNKGKSMDELCTLLQLSFMEKVHYKIKKLIKK